MLQYRGVIEINKNCINCDYHNNIKLAKCCKWCTRSIILENTTTLLCSVYGHGVIGCDSCPKFDSRYERSNYVKLQ